MTFFRSFRPLALGALMASLAGLSFVSCSYKNDSTLVRNFTITATAGDHGTLTPTGDIKVAEGGSQSFAFSASEGYVVDRVVVDGSPLAQADLDKGTYEFKNVHANATISAYFKLPLSNIALLSSATGYTWSCLVNATDVVGNDGTSYGIDPRTGIGQITNPGVNDNDLVTNIPMRQNGDIPNGYEGAGVIWTENHGVTSVSFINGDNDGGDNGWFEANVGLQYTTDGTTWQTTDWVIAPAYDYGSGSTSVGQTFTFSAGTTSLASVRGIRVVGQVRLDSLGNSWHWIVKEVQVLGD